MNSDELSAKALTQISATGLEFDAPPLGEKLKRNAGKVMKEIPLQRLQAGGEPLNQQRGSRYQWGEGIILNRNSRVGGGFWTNMPPSQLEDLRQVTADHPAIFLFCYYEITDGKLHVWAIPDEVAFRSLATVQENQSGVKTVFIDLRTQRFSYASDAPDLTSYYREINLSDAEIEALAASVKQDAAAKELAVSQSDDEEDSLDDESLDSERYNQQTVDYLLELPEHTTDGEWHVANKERFELVLRDPTNHLLEALREDCISRLDPAVAGTTHNVSKLKKNDFGRGGYNDHYWAAFFDPNAKSKIKSCQLFFRMLGNQRHFNYGFAFGNDCDVYIANLHAAIAGNRPAVQEYLLSAPDGTVVGLDASDDRLPIDVRVFAAQIGEADSESGQPTISPSAPISIIRQFALEELPRLAETLANDIGEFFRWAWPFFDAARTGVWSTGSRGRVVIDEDESEIEVDEDAPRTLQQLSELSALSINRLQEIEDALLTKQQVILTGPPGTSKTYIAQLFARYFAADRETNSQGDHTTLYMHANWAYEDFFEGIKPFTADGVLKFEPKLGCFLEWIESLRSFRPNARHVLVMDEINRCDTAAVLGELLQLLEYRGRAVRLLSGRMFRFPSNVYIIGTMNSADRSIGRMDLALRRRFLWLDLVPDYDILRTWLKRPGNNPARFSCDALRSCNQLLQDRGIAPEQQVGHALFMVQTFGNETQASEDKPLIPQALKRIVRFSVLPYVKELCVMQFGRVDASLVSQIEQVLLECLTENPDQPAITDPLSEPDA
ncbi:5-methylcytosine-specific restriction enzyme B [Rubripirellula tenax]|uniref:5-methylcytosine-specific restriction enzyme B n=1 Tax=Rubripirellula tenax TaxID=2528015 RepID=A0A5C6F391_9BACT|nr:AAA family ATPase [Rubripirellula tenax]TWU54897.1 5-methylcytosine-specific restriction enzyme B [Rubripirellula tenax]